MEPAKARMITPAAKFSIGPLQADEPAAREDLPEAIAEPRAIEQLEQLGDAVDTSIAATIEAVDTMIQDPAAAPEAALREDFDWMSRTPRVDLAPEPEVPLVPYSPSPSPEPEPAPKSEAQRAAEGELPNTRGGVKRWVPVQTHSADLWESGKRGAPLGRLVQDRINEGYRLNPNTEILEKPAEPSPSPPPALMPTPILPDMPSPQIPEMPSPVISPAVSLTKHFERKKIKPGVYESPAAKEATRLMGRTSDPDTIEALKRLRSASSAMDTVHGPTRSRTPRKVALSKTRTGMISNHLATAKVALRKARETSPNPDSDPKVTAKEDTVAVLESALIMEEAVQTNLEYMLPPKRRHRVPALKAEVADLTRRATSVLPDRLKPILGAPRGRSAPPGTSAAVPASFAPPALPSIAEEEPRALSAAQAMPIDSRTGLPFTSWADVPDGGIDVKESWAEHLRTKRPLPVVSTEEAMADELKAQLHKKARTKKATAEPPTKDPYVKTVINLRDIRAGTRPQPPGPAVLPDRSPTPAPTIIDLTPPRDPTPDLSTRLHDLTGMDIPTRSLSRSVARSVARSPSVREAIIAATEAVEAIRVPPPRTLDVEEPLDPERMRRLREAKDADYIPMVDRRPLVYGNKRDEDEYRARSPSPRRRSASVPIRRRTPSPPPTFPDPRSPRESKERRTFSIPMTISRDIPGHRFKSAADLYRAQQEEGLAHPDPVAPARSPPRAKRPVSPTMEKSPKVARVEEDPKDLFAVSWDQVSPATLASEFNDPENRKRVDTIKEKVFRLKRIPGALRPRATERARKAFLKSVTTEGPLKQFASDIANTFVGGLEPSDRATGDSTKATRILVDIDTRRRQLKRESDPERSSSRLSKLKRPKKARKGPTGLVVKSRVGRIRPKSPDRPAKKPRFTESEERGVEITKEAMRRRSEEKKVKARLELLAGQSTKTKAMVARKAGFKSYEAYANQYAGKPKR